MSLSTSLHIFKPVFKILVVSAPGTTQKVAERPKIVMQLSDGHYKFWRPSCDTQPQQLPCSMYRQLKTWMYNQIIVTTDNHYFSVIQTLLQTLLVVQILNFTFNFHTNFHFCFLFSPNIPWTKSVEHLSPPCIQHPTCPRKGLHYFPHCHTHSCTYCMPCQVLFHWYRPWPTCSLLKEIIFLWYSIDLG